MLNEISKATYTVDEAAIKLGISRNHAYEACHSGDIPSVRIGKRLLIPAAALDHMLQGEVLRRGRAE